MNAAMRSAEPTVTLRDVSRRARLGCKGAAAETFLRASSLPVPAGANSWVVDDSGQLVARLATAEFLVEATGQQAHVTTLADIAKGLGGTILAGWGDGRATAP